MSEKPNNAIDALSICNKYIGMYPSIFKLLQILAIILVLTTPNERKFSKLILKLIKTYLLT
jgi:hypothetical protein